MLHLIYILAFTVLAFLAVGNLIRNLMTLGIDSQRSYGAPGNAPGRGNQPFSSQMAGRPAPHPELLDESGRVVNEPFLVMRSITLDDAREQLDALYDASPGHSDEAHDEA